MARSLSAIGKVLVSITTGRFDLRRAAQAGAISATTSSSAATDGSDVITMSAAPATAAHDASASPPARFRRWRAAARRSVPTTR
jgi:transposase